MRSEFISRFHITTEQAFAMTDMRAIVKWRRISGNCTSVVGLHFLCNFGHVSRMRYCKENGNVMSEINEIYRINL